MDNNISLLFLTYSTITHIDAFSDYLDNCNIYIHPKYPDKVNKNLQKYIIPNLVETKWGDKSIVNATLGLLKEAYKNKNNKWFILCSEDIYPLVKYDELSIYLSKQKYSIFDVMDNSKNKTSQFWALKRDDVSKILTNKNKWAIIFDKIPRKSAVDELFFLPLLKNIDPSYKFTNSKFCYVKWFNNFVSKHPTVFNCLLEYDLNTIKTNNSCFIRKTYPTFKNEICPYKKLTILLVYGSESISEYNEFLSDFSNIANIFILCMVDKVDNVKLTNVCCQTYNVVWNDLENAIRKISNTFIGDIITTSEKLDVNKLKYLLNNSKLEDDNNNLFKINFDINNIKFFSGDYMLEEKQGNTIDDEKEVGKLEELEEKDETEEIEQLKESAESILLKLGDIILISDPSNEILNDNVFLIEYIDPIKIKLINSETFEKTVLQISPDGMIGDGNIQSIKVISSNPENGYARQNDLLPGTWVNIYFGGEIPTVITGKITNLEEDMIEIRTTDNDTIFINFAYQGIPEDLPIETFEIRPAIVEKRESDELESDELERDEFLEEKEGEKDIEDIEGIEEISKTVVKEKIKRMMFDMDDIQFGDVIKVEEYVQIDKDKYRYNIETQASDLLEEMLSTIPNYKRTNNVLNSIHIMITRFLQLRQISSTFDLNKNITGIIKRTSDDRPLAEYLSEFKNNLYWIMMVAKNVKKIYPDTKTYEYKRYDDYETLNLNDELKEMSSLYITTQSNRNVTSLQKTRYSSFTYKSFDKFMTPFYSVNPDTVNDVFAEPNGIIIEGNVETNINAIIDNLGDLYSTVIGNSEMTNRRFVIQKYNLASEKLHATSFKGQHLIAHRVKVAPNDSISINSIITLPEPTVRFSQVNLPGSNLLVKANLNLHFLNYWQLLKEKTNLTKIVVDGLENEIEYNETNFVDNIKQYLLDLSEYEKPENMSNLDLYKIFLRTIIPKIKILFSLVKKYIKGRLSLVDVVNYLEPFMIYPIDLTYMQYREINRFIYEKIKEYNAKFKEYGMVFSSLRYVKNQKSKNIYTFSNPLFSVLETKNDLKFNNEIMDIYGYEQPNSMQISGSEFLKNVTVADYGNLFNTSVAFTNLELMFPNSLSNVFDNDKERMKAIIEKDRQGDKCSSYVIAKKYYSSEALLADNQKPIYYDKEFDTTNYDLIEEKYKKQRDELSSEEFILFLSDEFQRKSKMDEVSAEYMANTLVNQAKKVREGDYALLILTLEGDLNEKEKMADQMEYYVRRDDIWVLDKDLDPKVFIKDDDVLCNIDYSCIYNPSLAQQKSENKCESTEVSKDTIIQSTLKQIIDQFDKNYDISQVELNTHITNKINYFKSLFDRLQQMKQNNFLKYNNIQYDLGLSVEDEIKNKKISPYTKLRDLIMGQNDFIKRQNDIVQFVSLYCYEGNPLTPNINDGEMEDEWWLYCNETNTKLLPKFHLILASTFINNNSKYDDVLNDLKRKIGKRSDDGDAWVDEHSGEIICYIDLDVSEGYKEGFIDTSRAIIEKDAGEIMLEKQKEKREKRLSPEGEIVSNIVSILSINMGINIEQSREFIIRVVTELMSDTKIIEKEPAYRKREEEAAKKGKKLPSYGTIYSSAILYLTLGIYLIGIQTSIPSIKTRKTAPGCVRSFSGFPFEGEGDDSSVNYVACVALKSRDPTTIPWNVLPKNEEKIVTTIKSFIIRYLLPYGEVQEKIKEKTEYLLVNPEEFIPEEHDLSKWLNFLPPLKIFNVKQLQNVSEGFTEQLQNELYTGNYRQLEKLLVIDSKIISFSLAIQEAIQKIVEKKSLLLKSAGQLFMDNACCNESGTSSVTSLQYFINDDSNIENYNNIVISLTALLRDIKILTESAIMLSEVTTKRNFPVVSNEFNEETIYRAFIVLCKFQSSIPLSEELASICVDKPDYLEKMDTIQEKISKLKRDGRNYTKEQFLRLFQMVSRNNVIKLTLGTKNMTCVDNLKKVLLILDEENNENVSKSLTQKLDKLVETYDIQIEEDTKEMRNLKDYLQSSIDKMRSELLEFIKLKAKLGSLELKNITKFITEISIWRFDKNTRNSENKISDDGLYNYINFMKSYIELFVVVFPSMIINQKTQSIEPPKYWGLAKDHANDVKDMVSEFYRPIEKFYGDMIIKNVLNEIIIKSRGTYLLSQNTPILTNIKIGEKEVYSVFDKRITTLLYEYYFLSVLTDYMYLTKDPSMVTRMLVNPETSVSDMFSADFLIEQQLRFSETEQEFIEGDVMKLNQEVAKLLVSYLKIMMNSKKTINVSYEDIEDKVFKLKEAEKYDFTDKLKDMSDEARAVDTILKHHKLGALYSLGMSKGIKEYDPEHFEHDKKIAENVAKIQNKLKRTKGVSDNIDLDDAIEEMVMDREIDLDIEMDMNPSDDYNDGDPWGDEMENFGEYD
jgi:hypothetical protein